MPNVSVLTVKLERVRAFRARVDETLVDYEKHLKSGRATYTRRMIEFWGHEGAAARAVEWKALGRGGGGYDTLAEHGEGAISFEQLMLDFPELFTEAELNLARLVLGADTEAA